jgi:hypothetical protein
LNNGRRRERKDEDDDGKRRRKERQTWRWTNRTRKDVKRMKEDGLPSSVSGRRRRRMGGAPRSCRVMAISETRQGS